MTAKAHRPEENRDSLLDSDFELSMSVADRRSVSDLYESRDVSRFNNPSTGFEAEEKEWSYKLITFFSKSLTPIGKKYKRQRWLDL